MWKISFLWINIVQYYSVSEELESKVTQGSSQLSSQSSSKSSSQSSESWDEHRDENESVKSPRSSPESSVWKFLFSSFFNLLASFNFCKDFLRGFLSFHQCWSSTGYWLKLFIQYNFVIHSGLTLFTFIINQLLFPFLLLCFILTLSFIIFGNSCIILPIIWR